MKVRVLSEAESDALDAACWYDERQGGLGDSFLSAYQNGLIEIEAAPHRFSRMETVKGLRNIRRYRLRQFPYSIVYELLSTEVLVLAVAHTSRRPNYWIKRRA